MIVVPSELRRGCRAFICGERPGVEEMTARPPTPFIGPAGRELWDRLWRVCELTREDCSIANLVRTFSPHPPSRGEIAEFRRDLQRDLATVKPQLIVTIGYHAARWFLPQFEGITGDAFHGLVFETPRVPGALVVPVVHSSAALRQPERYQNQLTDDLRAVKRVLDGRGTTHAPTVSLPMHVGLATLLADATDAVVGLDTEGALDRPWRTECISLNAREDATALVETYQEGRGTDALAHVKAIIARADRLAIHHAKHDVKALATLGVRVPWDRVDDTMEMAFLLGLPQGLKQLMARRHQWAMEDYESLILPLDEQRVRTVLEEVHGQAISRSSKGPSQSDRHRVRSAGPGRYRTQRVEDSSDGAGAADPLPRRALTSLRKFLSTPIDTPLRERWQKSTFAEHITLPPVPTWQDLPQAQRTSYALTDAWAHRVLRNDLWKLVQRRGLERAYAVDMGVLPLLSRNEQVGLACDRRQLRRLSWDFQAQFDATCADINDLAGFAVNPLSGDQVAECLFHELGLTPTRKTKSGKHYTTADKYLKARRHEHAIVQRILDARQLNKYLGTYTNKLPDILQQDREGVWRYYPDWKYTRTATGRLAEAIILLIPKHDPLAKAQGRPNRAKQIRNAFYATPGHVLVSVDLSQIELRVMAHLSQDEVLLNAYREGRDIHAEVAHSLLGAPREKKDQDESAHRLPAKTVNFGVINGMTEFGMLDQLHEAGQLQWDIAGVRELLEGWWRRHVGVQRYWDRQVAHAEDYGWIDEPLFGRRRYLTSAWTSDERVYMEAKRQCLFGIQSAADSISKVWNAAVWERIIRPRQRAGTYCEFWVRIHDDTTLEVEASEAEAVKAEMLGLVPQLLDIPTLAEGKIGERWGEL